MKIGVRIKISIALIIKETSNAMLKALLIDIVLTLKDCTDML